MRNLRAISKKELLDVVESLKPSDYVQDVAKYGDYLIVTESWDMECLKNYRDEYKKPKMKYDDALRIYNREMSKKLKAKLVRTEWFKRISVSIFRKIKKK